MTAPSIEPDRRPEHLDSDLLANALLWVVPVIGFVAALLGLG